MEEARQALAEEVAACPHCRPEAALEVLEWGGTRRAVALCLLVSEIPDPMTTAGAGTHQ
ncbi:DUF6233 domain-containing protein [Streptomyces sp. WM6372]|uniref:DUF6233 domain-containing protein n=1 Tax=Streptomyces sp. WM6372 TaxID=1415555 RepID=UPI003B63974B